MKRLPKKSYTSGFKKEAVRLVEEGKGASQVARELVLAIQTLNNWHKAAKLGKVGGEVGKPSRRYFSLITKLISRATAILAIGCNLCNGKLQLIH